MIDYEFHSLLQGGIMAGPRPSRKFLKSIQGFVDTVITLQWETESVEEIQSKCQELEITWIWCPIKAVNWEIYKNDSVRTSVLSQLVKAKELLQEGHNLLIHCAAGIHRTGFFLYNLLRLCGKSAECTMDSILTIRPQVLDRIGRHRLEVSENFFLFSQGEQVFTPFYETLQLKQSDFVTGKKRVVLFWVKVFFDDFLAKVQFSATPDDFSKIVVGGEVFLNVVEKPKWASIRNFQSGGEEPVKSIWYFSEVLREFIFSCQCDATVYLAGEKCFLDKEFLMIYCPEVLKMMSYRIVDLSCFNEVVGGVESGSIYDDMKWFMKVRDQVLRSS
jgi:hypothetical protein